LTNYQPETNGKCPHCGYDVCFAKLITSYWNGMRELNYSDTLRAFGNEKENNEDVYAYAVLCPNKECQKPIVAAEIHAENKQVIRLVHPYNVSRIVSSDVPKEIRQSPYVPILRNAD
jgi:hypothetical protein